MDSPVDLNSDGRAWRMSRRRSGFSLIEMLVVIAIIGMLAAMIVGIYGVVVRNKTLASARAEMQHILSLLSEYQLKAGAFPQSGSSDITAIKKDLEGVLGESQVSSKTDFLDPWDGAFQYVRRNANSCSVFSKGPDGESGSKEADIDNVSTTE